MILATISQKKWTTNSAFMNTGYVNCLWKTQRGKYTGRAIYPPAFIPQFMVSIALSVALSLPMTVVKPNHNMILLLLCN